MGEKIIDIKDLPYKLKEIDFQTKYDGLKQAIVLVGCTGKGKSSLAALIQGNSEIFAEEINDHYLIIDPKGRISGRESTTVSHTILPEPIWYEGLPSNTRLIDCPGFEDTRNTAMDILCTISTAEVLRLCNSIKLVLVVSYNDVNEGGDRKGFTSLVDLLSDFTTSFSKFKKSIALFVTKVPNIFVDNEDGTPTLVADDKMKMHIQNFLLGLKKTFSSEKNVPAEKMNIYKNTVILIDIILSKDGNTYNTSRIGLFRCPRKGGQINLMKPFQETRANLQEIIQNKIQFTKTEDSTFKFAISPESKVCLQEVIQVIVNESNNDIKRIIDGIGKSYENYEITSTDIEMLAEKFRKLNSIWQDFTEYVQRLNGVTSGLDFFIKQLDVLCCGDTISHLKTVVGDLMRAKKLVDLLETVSNKKFSTSTQQWIQLFHGIKTRVYNTYTWYAALLNISEVSSTYEVQSKQSANTRSTYFEKLNKWASSDKQVLIPGKNVQDAVTGIIQTNIGYNLDFGVSPTKLRHLLNLSKYAFHETTVIFDGDLCRVKGHFVLLSAISYELKKAKTLEILATCKLFIDCDIDAIGQELQVAIIAPKWEVVGESRLIRLDGVDGLCWEGPAISKFIGTKGADGEPGRPGGCSGSLVSVVEEIINGDSLMISANGGKGGKGQNGASGANGIKGVDAELRRCQWECIRKDMSLYKQEYLLRGTNGQPGNHGGNGGSGGLGGFPGHVILHGLMNRSTPHICAKVGSVGENGKGGAGGVGGVHGMHHLYIVDGSHLRISFETFKKSKNDHCRGKANDGTAGADGATEVHANHNSSTMFHGKGILVDFNSVIKRFDSLSKKKPTFSPNYWCGDHFLKLLSEPSLRNKF